MFFGDFSPSGRRTLVVGALRGRDPALRAELARKVAGIWEEDIGDAREAADAWRRVLRMKAGDTDATAGLERAKSGKLKRAPPPPAVEIRSQVVVESDPPGAPLTVYVRKSGASPFVIGTANPGWQKVVENEKTPHDVSLAAGEYHLVLDAFRDLKRSETDLELKPGRVYNFKANLSQGAFLGFLRVTSPVFGARVHVDDPPPFAKGLWGRAPHGDLLEPGPHTVWIEASGYETIVRKIKVERGDTVEVAAPLERVSYGFLLVDANADDVSVKVDGVPYAAYSA